MGHPENEVGLGSDEEWESGNSTNPSLPSLVAIILSVVS